MKPEWFRVPENLVLDPKLTQSSKLVGIALSYLGDSGRATRAQLRKLTGLSVSGVKRSLGQLVKRGWITLHKGPPKAPPAKPPDYPIWYILYNKKLANPVQLERTWAYRVHTDLLIDRTLKPRAKIAYLCILALNDGVTRAPTTFGQEQLQKCTGQSKDTLRAALGELVTHGWASINKKGLNYEIRLKNPKQQQRYKEKDEAKARIDQAIKKGQAILREILRLLVPIEQASDEMRPDFLKNPLTGFSLELDIYYYEEKIGFEFNAPQHDRLTELFPYADELDRQRIRDHIKRKACEAHGVKLFTLRTENLEIEYIKNLIQADLPIRELSDHQPLHDYLTGRAERYRNRAALGDPEDREEAGPKTEVG